MMKIKIIQATHPPPPPPPPEYPVEWASRWNESWDIRNTLPRSSQSASEPDEDFLLSTSSRTSSRTVKTLNYLPPSL